ncbi:MAG: DUF5060 domain-containing protein [Saprospiraceae bacterium]|nr:DUF5060 domain-containing protein [Saprospiraceae bacterium]
MISPNTSFAQQKAESFLDQILQQRPSLAHLKAHDFPTDKTQYYRDKHWLAINPNRAKEAKSSTPFPFTTGMYDVIFLGVGENDGASAYQVWVDGAEIGAFTCGMSKHSFEEGVLFSDLWENVELKKRASVQVQAKIGSADGQEYSRGRWAGLIFAPQGEGRAVLQQSRTKGFQQNVNSPAVAASTARPNQDGRDGDGTVKLEGELKQWHKVTLSMAGPFAQEMQEEPNPFLDYRMTVQFTHESGSPSYEVPGYFAADGNAAETSANAGNIWRAHLSPDKAGRWDYQVSFRSGKMIALTEVPWANTLATYHNKKGSFEVEATDKGGRDFRAKGRLEYVGKHFLQFKGEGSYFLKAGTDAPETLLAYQDFDDTYTAKTKLKTWSAHEQDWKIGDPTWKGTKGKGLIGALNYLAGKGANAFSFLTYNAGGDGDNVWPFVKRETKYNYDCSKLDQWQIVFDHAQRLGLYLHFKLQETENDDHTHGKKASVPASLDGGELGPQRRLYLRELIARYGYLLALNWNLGEENTQSKEQRQAMAAYIKNVDPYAHNIVLHTFPRQQNQVYNPLLGDASVLTGVSLQNDWKATHRLTLQWRQKSAEAGRPWVVANDEQGSASQGVPPDPGYQGYQANQIAYDLHDIRKQVLWGNFMAGGAGVEYYFGYKLPENDLICEDFRSRDQTWDYCRIALDFFHDLSIPFWEMENQNKLIGNSENGKEKMCLAKEGEIYLVYLAYTETTELDLTGVSGKFSVEWFNPRKGGALGRGKVKRIKGGKVVSLGKAPLEREQDWMVVVRKWK